MKVENGVREQQGNQLLELLAGKLGNQIIESRLSLGDAEVLISAENVLDFFGILKLDNELAFNLLLSVTAVDWLDKHDDYRFEVVYHLLSTSKKYRLRVKVRLPEVNPEVASLVMLWSGANFMEREAWDMYGINFKGHPDQRRILTYDEFKGHPLRKDYPVQGKQPRIPLRAPEVRNTAVDMARSELVQINLKKKNKVGSRKGVIRQY